MSATPTVRVSILISDATVGCGAVPSCTRLMLAAVTPTGARPPTPIEVVSLWLYPIFYIWLEIVKLIMINPPLLFTGLRGLERAANSDVRDAVA